MVWDAWHTTMTWNPLASLLLEFLRKKRKRREKKLVLPGVEIVGVILICTKVVRNIDPWPLTMSLDSITVTYSAILKTHIQTNLKMGAQET